MTLNVAQSPAASTLKENTRPKSTLNLSNILKSPAKAEEKTAEQRPTEVVKTNTLLLVEDVKNVWADFAELKKSQAGEYNLLKRGFDLNETKITIPLANSVEEPLLQSIRTQLTAYLRDRLNNSNINVFGALQDIETKRVAYTNKEKFDYLAEKNPILIELKERLGLDTDY